MGADKYTYIHTLTLFVKQFQETSNQQGIEVMNTHTLLSEIRALVYLSTDQGIACPLLQKLEHTIYFPNNGSVTVGYHSFPNGFTTFLSTHSQHSVVVQYAINTIIAFLVADTKLLYFGNFITAAKTCTSILTHCFSFLLGNSTLAMF